MPLIIIVDVVMPTHLCFILKQKVDPCLECINNRKRFWGKEGVVISAPGEGEPEVKSPGNGMVSFMGEMLGSVSVCSGCFLRSKSVGDKESHHIIIKSAARSPVFKPNPLKKKRILLAHFPPVCVAKPLYLPVKMQMWPTGTNSTMKEAGWTDSL